MGTDVALGGGVALAVGSKTGGPVSPNGIYVTALDSNERKLLVPGGSNAKYAEGYLLFLREQTLMAQAFDVERLELASEAVPIAEHVTIGGIIGMAGGYGLSETSPVVNSRSMPWTDSAFTMTFSSTCFL